MRDQRSRTVAGSCLGATWGGILGGVLGVILGWIIASASAEARTQEDKRKDPFGIDACGAFVTTLIGAAVGGFIFGAAGGSMLGAGLASRGSEPSSPDLSVTLPALPVVEGDAGAAAPATVEESPEEELARLKERIAELEQKSQTAKDGIQRKE